MLKKSISLKLLLRVPGLYKIRAGAKQHLTVSKADLDEFVKRPNSCCKNSRIFPAEV